MFPRFLSLAVSLLAPVVLVAGDFQEWLTKNHEGESARSLSFSAPEGTTIENLAQSHQWKANGVDLSASRPPGSPEEDGYGSISFNGIDSELVISPWADAGFSDQCSMGVWIKPDLSVFRESRESRFIVGKSASREAGFHIGLNERSQITVGIVTASGYVSVRTDAVIEPYRWHHVGFSWNGESLQVYIDGVAHGEAVEALAPYRDYTAASLTFGRPASLAGHYYRGEIGGFALIPHAYPEQSQP